MTSQGTECTSSETQDGVAVHARMLKVNSCCAVGTDNDLQLHRECNSTKGQMLENVVTLSYLNHTIKRLMVRGKRGGREGIFTTCLCTSQSVHLRQMNKRIQ